MMGKKVHVVVARKNPEPVEVPQRKDDRGGTILLGLGALGLAIAALYFLTKKAEAAPQCGAGTVWDPTTKTCIPVGVGGPICPTGYIWDGAKCVKTTCQPQLVGLVWTKDETRCTTSVSGKLIDASTGTPLGGRTVNLFMPNPAPGITRSAVFTAADGSFAMLNINASGYTSSMVFSVADATCPSALSAPMANPVCAPGFVLASPPPQYTYVPQMMAGRWRSMG